MIQDIQRLLDASPWLKDKTVLRQIDQWVEITTPISIDTTTTSRSPGGPMAGSS